MTDGERAVFLNMLAERITTELGRGYTCELKCSGTSNVHLIVKNVKSTEFGVDLRSSDELGVYVRGQHGYEHIRDLRDPTFDPVGFVVEYVRERRKD